MPNLTYQPIEQLEQTVSQVTVPLDKPVNSQAANYLVNQHRMQGNFALIMRDSLHIYPLSSGANCIGRHKDCRVRLSDQVVSRQHAQIVLTGTGLVLTDLCSTNGTFVNGVRVNGSVLVRGGDRIKIGQSEFVVAA